MTYLVMETHLSYSVVLDENGSFLKVANMSYEIGQRVDEVILLAPNKAPVDFFQSMRVGGLLAACLLLCFTLYRYSFLSPIGNIYLAINPSVQIQVSRRDTVVSLVGLNNDGRKIIQNYSYKGKHIDLATEEIIESAIQLGFLSNGDTITAFIDAPDDEWFAEIGTRLSDNVSTYLSDKMEVTIIIKPYNPDASGAQSPPPTPTQKQTQTQTAPTTVKTAPSSIPSEVTKISTTTVQDDSRYGDSDFGNINNQTVAPTPQPQPTPTPPPTPTVVNDSGYSDYSPTPNIQTPRNNDSGYDDSGYVNSGNSGSSGNSGDSGNS